MKAEEELRAVASEVRACQACKLHLSRKNAVPGEGPAASELMFIGEGPGFHENEQGRPFVGAAGKYLDELLAKIGLSREQVFIGNVVKCRPPGNRDPLPEEIQACAGYLERQVDAIQPRVIVTLGRFSMARYFPNTRISDIHGQARTVNGRMVVAMYHPAAALHQPSLRREIEADFARLPGLIQRAAPPASESETKAPPQQLNLF
ncbi:MAG: uracil-DNA glycosylase [Chloroflexi bacterium]|nr:uracil-DNA glycosylase [Chloroflexota bacterium]